MTAVAATLILAKQVYQALVEVPGIALVITRLAAPAH